MLVVSWISMLWFLQYGSALGHHTRHERTRYVSGRNQIYGSYSPNFDHDQSYIPFVHFWERPLQVLESSMNVPKKLSSRPLFSWDLPIQLSTYNPSRKVSTTTEKPLNDVSNPLPEKEPKIHENDVNALTYVPKTVQKTRSDRLNRAKDSIAYEKPYTHPKKKKSTNRKKSIEESPRVIRWRQADAQSPGKVENEPKRLKRKKKGKKSKKVRLEKLKEKRNKVSEKFKSEMNDGVIETNPPSGEFLGAVVKSKMLLEKRKQEEVRKTTTQPPPVPTVPPCELMEEKCEHECKNVDGAAQCVCFRGFTPVGNRCVDINECEEDDGGCNGRCVNTLGSRKCICAPGFRLVDGVCADINECLLRNGHGPCQDQCTNTVGSYLCSCEGLPGTTLSSNKHTCEEDNDCGSNSSGCSHSCISMSGRTFCTCPDGLELGEDWKTCHDIDECSNPEDYDVECPTQCVNTIGSYTCTRGNTTNDNFT